MKFRRLRVALAQRLDPEVYRSRDRWMAHARRMYDAWEREFEGWQERIRG